MAPAQPLQATLAEFHADRPAGADEDVHMCTAIVDHVINAYSAPGDLVFDPFAGFGTTLSRAVALGRRAAGVELLPGRVAQIHATTPEAHVVEGDARRFLPQLASSQPPAAVNLILTSPPYMAETETDTDPLEAYEQGSGDYQRYLAELNDVARDCAQLIVPGGHVVWNVGDIQHGGVYTPLIDDCAALLAQHLERITVTDIQWDEYPHDITRDALLVFHRC